MWALLSVCYFAGAVLLNALVSRVRSIPPIVSFLISGTVIGLILIGHAVAVLDAPISVVAAVMCYAAASELFLIVVTMLSSSVATRSIRYLHDHAMTEASLASVYSEHHMVKLRLERIERAGLAENPCGAWQLTRRGIMVLTVLRKLRAFFGHPSTL